MKRTMLASALTATAAIAHAQSSVTLYGAVDTSVAYFSNAQGSGSSGPVLRLSSGNMAPGMWGLRGTEDLGGGLAAIFKLESGFNIDNGQLRQGQRMFGRVAFVGLSDSKYGTVTLGRQYDPLIDLLQLLTNDWGLGSTFATPGDMDNYDNSYRTNNSIKYASPSYAGFQWSAIYGFGGASGSVDSGQTYAAAIAYNRGPLGIGAGYFRATSNGTTASFDGLNPNASSFAVDTPVITGGFVSASSLQMVRAAAHYQFGRATFGVAYSNVRYANYATTDAAHGTSSFNTGQAFVNYAIAPDALVGLGYDYTKASGDGVSAGYSQLSAGADYFLSKQTDLYALAAYQKAAGNTVDAATGRLVPAVASIADFGIASSTDKQVMTMIGIRHKF